MLQCTVMFHFHVKLTSAQLLHSCRLPRESLVITPITHCLVTAQANMHGTHLSTIGNNHW
jgi:hypothetical protein